MSVAVARSSYFWMTWCFHLMASHAIGDANRTYVQRDSPAAAPGQSLMSFISMFYRNPSRIFKNIAANNHKPDKFYTRCLLILATKYSWRRPTCRQEDVQWVVRQRCPLTASARNTDHTHRLPLSRTVPTHKRISVHSRTYVTSCHTRRTFGSTCKYASTASYYDQ